MCTNGINTTQFEQLIDQIDDYVALQVRHTHKLAHAADNAGYENCHLKLHAASDMLAEVRNLLDDRRTVYSAYESDRVRRLRSGAETFYRPFATSLLYAYGRSATLTVSYKF